MRIIDNNVVTLSFRKGERVVEINKDWYYHLRNSVTPRAYGNNGHIVSGEPYAMDSDGRVVYIHCFKYEGKLYAGLGYANTPLTCMEALVINENKS